MSETKTKKIVKKSTTSKKVEQSQPVKSPAESETSSILDNDYRTILSSYNPSKNKSRPIITIYERSAAIPGLISL